MTIDGVEQLEQAIGYSFRDKKLLETALTHSSHAREHGVPDNETLEFLGDAVLDLAVSELLMAHRPDDDEGDLSRSRAALVNAKVLSTVGGALDIGRWLKLGRGEERGGGRTKQRLIASAYEAVIGAVFKDADYETCRACVANHFGERLVNADPSQIDHKTRLQEMTQARFKTTPEYRVAEVTGPDHGRTYRVELYVEERLIATGSGSSRKTAEMLAAKAALATLGSKPDGG